jgi:GTP-binding protein EngB required for normal cell division
MTPLQVDDRTSFRPGRFWSIGMDLSGGDRLNPSGGERPEPLPALLARCAANLLDLWPDREGYATGLQELRARLVEERLQIAVLGQFKRGKSTFLNALLGQPILPTGVVPITAIPTLLRWASGYAIEVGYSDGRMPERLASAEPARIRAELFRLVTEAGNPKNRERVARVEVFLPSPILEHGIVLIDTPGIGSTLRHNTDAALEVLPQCDAAFFVLSADPPVTAAELDYLAAVRPQVARLFFILNKIDYLAESDLPVAVDFLRRSLREHVPAEAEIAIFSLSARHGLEAKGKGDAKGVEQSGLGGVERHLAEFLAREKTEALARAAAAKAGRLLDAARIDVLLAVRALELPIEDLQKRAAKFAEALRQIEDQRLAARDLLAGDRRRALDRLEVLAEMLRGEARAVLRAVPAPALASRHGERQEEAVRNAMAAAIPDFFGPRMAEISRALGGEVDEALARQVRRADALIASVRETAAALFEIPLIRPGGSEVFAIKREPYWVTQKWDETLDQVVLSAVDKLLPASVRAARLKRRLAGEIEDLVQRNVENLRWATWQNLEDAFRHFSAWFDARLAAAITATRGSIDAALAKRRDHARDAGDDLARLRDAAQWLEAAQRDLRARAGEYRGARAESAATPLR